VQIVVASKNPVKLRAVEAGFHRVFPGEGLRLESISVPSGVRDQPFSDVETLDGARSRAKAALQRFPQADYWVGVEGGVQDEGFELLAFAWVVILSRNGSGKGRTGAFVLPPRVAELIRQGKELGEADDIVFGRTNSKQENGAVGLLTGNLLDRAQLYEQAVVLALIPLINQELYRQSPDA
jgi:inosine/xanthosine triphosphatase